MVNDSQYGLAASLWTNDLGQAMRLIPQIEAGTVWVNTRAARPEPAVRRLQTVRYWPRVWARRGGSLHRTEIGVHRLLTEWAEPALTN